MFKRIKSYIKNNYAVAEPQEPQEVQKYYFNLTEIEEMFMIPHREARNALTQCYGKGLSSDYVMSIKQAMRLALHTRAGKVTVSDWLVDGHAPWLKIQFFHLVEAGLDG